METEGTATALPAHAILVPWLNHPWLRWLPVEWTTGYANMEGVYVQMDEDLLRMR